jgi:hypothetical protein
LWLALASPALFEPITVAVHFEDVDVVGQSVEQRTGQPVGPEHAGPFVEWQIVGDDGGAALVALAEDLKQQLGAGRRQGYIAELCASMYRLGAAGRLLSTGCSGRGGDLRLSNAQKGRFWHPTSRNRRNVG